MSDSFFIIFLMVQINLAQKIAIFTFESHEVLTKNDPIWLWWFDFRLKLISGNDRANPKIVDHVKSGQM